MNDDWNLIQRFREGDESAFTELFDRHKAMVINLAFRFLRAREAAEDTAQDVFIKIYRKNIPFDPRDTGAQFSTWLYRVTVHAALDALRKRRPSEPLPEDHAADSAAGPLANLQQEERLRKIQQAVHALPQKLRAPLILHQFQGLQYAQIASILKVTEKTVERRMYRARHRLKKIFKKWGMEPGACVS